MVNAISALYDNTLSIYCPVLSAFLHCHPVIAKISRAAMLHCYPRHWSPPDTMNPCMRSCLLAWKHAYVSSTSKSRSCSCDRRCCWSWSSSVKVLEPRKLEFSGALTRKHLQHLACFASYIHQHVYGGRTREYRYTQQEENSVRAKPTIPGKRLAQPIY